LEFHASEFPYFRTFPLKIIACVDSYIGRKIGSLGKVVGYARNKIYPPMEDPFVFVITL